MIIAPKEEITSSEEIRVPLLAAAEVTKRKRSSNLGVRKLLSAVRTGSIHRGRRRRTSIKSRSENRARKVKNNRP